MLRLRLKTAKRILAPISGLLPVTGLYIVIAFLAGLPETDRESGDAVGWIWLGLPEVSNGESGCICCMTH